MRSVPLLMILCILPCLPDCPHSVCMGAKLFFWDGLVRRTDCDHVCSVAHVRSIQWSTILQWEGVDLDVAL